MREKILSLSLVLPLPRAEPRITIRIKAATADTISQKILEEKMPVLGFLTG